MPISRRDQLLLQRFFDRELSGGDAATFRARLEREPELGAALAELEETRAGFTAGREEAFSAPAGFTAGVLGEVRQLPSRIEMQEAQATGRALVLCRRVLLAAGILFGLGLCWHAGLFDGSDATTLEAAPDEIERELEQLDEVARSLAWPADAGPAGAGPGTRPLERPR